MVGISENIKKLRERYDLTQQDLADIAGVTNKAVSAWETGQKEPRMGAIEKISKRFGLRKSHLIEDGGMDNLHETNSPDTIAAHFEGENFTDEEIKEILDYVKYIKSKRK